MGRVFIRQKQGTQLRLSQKPQYILFLKLVSITFPWMSGQKSGSVLKKVVLSCMHHFEMQSSLRQVLYWQIQLRISTCPEAGTGLGPSHISHTYEAEKMVL